MNGPTWNLINFEVKTATGCLHSLDPLAVQTGGMSGSDGVVVLSVITSGSTTRIQRLKNTIRFLFVKITITIIQ